MEWKVHGLEVGLVRDVVPWMSVCVRELRYSMNEICYTTQLMLVRFEVMQVNLR